MELAGIAGVGCKLGVRRRCISWPDTAFLLNAPLSGLICRHKRRPCF